RGAGHHRPAGRARPNGQGEARRLAAPGEESQWCRAENARRLGEKERTASGRSRCCGRSIQHAQGAVPSARDLRVRRWAGGSSGAADGGGVFMPVAHIVRSIPVVRTARVLQLEGLFEIPPTQRSDVVIEANLPIEEKPWNIGLIVGPSGCGKTTVARELFGADLVSGFDWPEDYSLVDGFPESMSIKEITGLLSSVGFPSPPSWLRPFRVLSNGEQFRATIARALAENRSLTVIDEFSSVVDRTVAQIGSAAVAKTVRRRNQKLIAVSCHYDIL